MATDRPGTPEEAIFDMHARLVRQETTLTGTPGTDDGGLVQDVKELKALAIETKDVTIAQGNRLTKLEEWRKNIIAGGGLSRGRKAGLWGGISAAVAGIIVGLWKAFGSHSGG